MMLVETVGRLIPFVGEDVQGQNLEALLHT